MDRGKPSRADPAEVPLQDLAPGAERVQVLPARVPRMRRGDEWLCTGPFADLLHEREYPKSHAGVSAGTKRAPAIRPAGSVVLFDFF